MKAYSLTRTKKRIKMEIFILVGVAAVVAFVIVKDKDRKRNADNEKNNKAVFREDNPKDKIK